MINKLTPALLLIAFLTSCNSLKVIHHSDTTIDISQSKSFSYNGWFGETDDLWEVDVKNWEKAFATELKKRGLTYKPTDGDIVITIMSVVNKETTTNRYNSFYGSGAYGFYQPTWGWGVGHGYGYGGRDGGYAGVPYKENAYLRGTIICDVFDGKSKKLAWQGIISKAFNPKAKKLRMDIPSVADRLLKEFPIPVQE